MSVDPVTAKAAGVAGSVVSKYLLRKALGSPRQRALEGVYRRAAERAVLEVAATESVTSLDVVHAVALLEQLVAAAGTGDLPLLRVEPVDERAVTGRWREMAAERGFDAETFPLPFERLIQRLLSNVAAEALNTAVDGADNSLFPAVAAAQLEDLRRGVRILARTIPLDGQVERELEAARRSCQAADRTLLTPDVLLALLQLPDGAVFACFDAVRPALAGRIVAALRRHQQTVAVRPFRPFQWVERAEIRQAQTIAWVNGMPAVSGPVLLLGLLDTPSNTRDQLMTALGEQSETLRDAAWARLDTPVAYTTPGVVFGHLEDGA